MPPPWLLVCAIATAAVVAAVDKGTYSGVGTGSRPIDAAGGGENGGDGGAGTGAGRGSCGCTPIRARRPSTPAPSASRCALRSGWRGSRCHPHLHDGRELALSGRSTGCTSSNVDRVNKWDWPIDSECALQKVAEAVQFLNGKLATPLDHERCNHAATKNVSTHLPQPPHSAFLPSSPLKRSRQTASCWSSAP